MKDNLVINIIRDETSLQFFQENISDYCRNPFPFHRLSAKLIKACACGVLANRYSAGLPLKFWFWARGIRNSFYRKVDGPPDPTIFLKRSSSDWNGRYETPAGKAWHGRPRRRAEEAPARPRKASA